MLIFGTSVKNWSRKVFLTNVSYTFTQLVQLLRPKIAIFSMWWLVMSIFRNRKFFSWRSCFACVLFRSRDTTLLKKISKFTKAILRYGFFNFFRGGGGGGGTKVACFILRGGGDENFKMCFFRKKSWERHQWSKWSSFMKKNLSRGGGDGVAGGGGRFLKKRHFCVKYQIFFRHRTEKRTKKLYLTILRLGTGSRATKYQKIFLKFFFPKIFVKMTKNFDFPSYCMLPAAWNHVFRLPQVPFTIETLNGLVYVGTLGLQTTKYAIFASKHAKLAFLDVFDVLPYHNVWCCGVKVSFLWQYYMHRSQKAQNNVLLITWWVFDTVSKHEKTLFSRFWPKKPKCKIFRNFYKLPATGFRTDKILYIDKLSHLNIKLANLHPQKYFFSYIWGQKIIFPWNGFILVTGTPRMTSERSGTLKIAFLDPENPIEGILTPQYGPNMVIWKSNT